MLDALAAHGPEGLSMASCAGASRPGAVALGHRRLKITAEDEWEQQPLAGVSGSAGGVAASAWLVADARIDNRMELARELGVPVSGLVRTPDSAWVQRAWQRWGQECVQRLVGSFAFAVWDGRAEEFFVARDHAGDRPIYYWKTAEGFAFATTARAVRAVPGVSSELDERQLVRDLMGIPPEYPRTRFREICELAPGHCMVVRRGGVETRRYWKIDALSPLRFPRDDEYVEAFREVFDEAVRCRLRTTGGVAAELSAGLDSGAVAATAAGILAAGGETLAAYTGVPCAGFSGAAPPGAIADEGPYAAEVAALYPNMTHTRVDARGSDMLRELARIYPLLDLPHAAALNSVWSHRIYDRARQAGAKVMLAGSLGNFAFSYSGAEMLHTIFRRGRWLSAAREASRLRRMGLGSGRGAASQTVFGLLPWRLRRRVDPMIRAVGLDGTAVNRGRARELNAVEQLRRYMFTRRSALPHLMETQFQMNQYGDYNAAVGAGWGIETRDPTADKRVFEFCAAIPPEQFVLGGQGRSLVRRAMRGRLPDATLDRRDRGTQAADWYERLSEIRGELAAEIARQQQSPVARTLIDLEMLRCAVEDWPKNAEDAMEKAAMYQSAIPRGLAVGYFIRRIEEEAHHG
jgi:asparagine synthase (glutamine-hydrolysing)